MSDSVKSKIKADLNLSREHNGNDQPIDGDSLAEDDRDQILSLDPGSLDPTTHNGGAAGVDAQPGSHHGEGHSEPNPHRCPHVGGGLGEEPSEVNSLPSSSKKIVEN